jgi:hypothetical protein
LGNLVASLDLGLALASYEQGLAALEAVGNRERISVLLVNVAATHLSLGLAVRGRDELDRVAQMDLEMGTRLAWRTAWTIVTVHLNPRGLAELTSGRACWPETGDSLKEGGAW